MHLFLLLPFTHSWFTLVYSAGSAVVFGWTLATKAYLYYNILTVYLYYILSNIALDLLTAQLIIFGFLSMTSSFLGNACFFQN